MININKQIGCKTYIFPDGQPHIILDDKYINEDIEIVCSITNTNLLLLLLQCNNALSYYGIKRKILTIPYLMGARYDRIMQEGDSFDLKVIAKLINDCNFDRVFLYDVHSDVATALINNSINLSNEDLAKLTAQEIDEYYDKYCIGAIDFSNIKNNL